MTKQGTRWQGMEEVQARSTLRSCREVQGYGAKMTPFLNRDHPYVRKTLTPTRAVVTARRQTAPILAAKLSGSVRV